MEPPGPFDGDDAVFVEKIPQADLIRVHRLRQPVEINMKKRQPAGVFIDDRIGGTGNDEGGRNVQPAGKALGKRSFPAAQIAEQQEDEAVIQSLAQGAAQGDGLIVGMGLKFTGVSVMLG